MEASRACQLVSFPSPCFFQGLTGLEVATIHPTNIYCIREREREREVSKCGPGPRNLSSCGALYRYLYLWMRHSAVRPWLRIHPRDTNFCQEPGVQQNVNLFFFQLSLHR